MRTRLIVGAILFALAAMGASDCASDDDSKPLNNGDEPTQQAEEETRQAEDAPPTPAEKSDGEYDLNCAYELGDFGESGDPAKGYRFTAGGTLMNTGNTNIRVRVTYEWKRLGTAPKRVRKVYKLRKDQERDVNVTVVASENDIDAHQNAQGQCKATAKIIGAF